LSTALFVSSLNFGLIGSDLGLDIFWFDQGVVQLDLLVAVTEFFLDFSRADADAVGNEFGEFLLKQALPDQILKDRNGELKARLHFGSITIPADEIAALISIGKNLANTIGAFLVGNGDAQAFSFVFERLLKDKLVKNPLRVEPFKPLRNRIVPANLIELPADIGDRYFLIADLGDGVGGHAARSRRLRDKIEEHAAPQNHDHRSESDAIPKFAIVARASHPMNLPSP